MPESLFNKVAGGPGACNFIKKILQHRCFPVKFTKFLRTPFLQNTSGGCFYKEKEICPACISNHNSTHEKEIILLKIPNKEKEGWHCLAVKKINKRNIYIIKRNNIKPLW